MGLIHTAAILSQETKAALSYLSNLAPKFFTARSRVVKQSFFSLSGPYGCRVNKTHWVSKVIALNRGNTSDFLLVMVMRFFLEIVASPARGGGYTSDKICDFVAKSSTNFSRFFLCDILALTVAVLAQAWLHVWLSLIILEPRLKCKNAGIFQWLVWCFSAHP